MQGTAPLTPTPERPISTSPSRPRRARRAAAVAALAVVAGSAVAVVASGDRGTGSSGQVTAGSGGTSGSGPGGGPSGMAHVHGLGVDPATGHLVAGTHHGTFRVSEDGRAEQVGPTQDVMGFTVVGPGRYLASGHPGPGQDAPGDLGLLESTDGGATWTPLSLAGEADFHALEARHGRVYGHSRGTLLVSEDMRSWEQRARLPLADLAVSPDDPDALLATTQQGLASSSDGGRTFALLDAAPVLVLVSWTDGGTVVGVDPAGRVHASPDGGRTWQARGESQGQPVALHADDEAVHVATHDGRIVASRDGGRTFRDFYRDA